MSKHKIQYDFENAVNAYMEVFCKKQDESFEWWVGDEIGGIACMYSERFYNFDDIRRDIDENIPAGDIKEWHDNTMNKDINYNSYLMGAR